jgi:hypothetical protein
MSNIKFSLTRTEKYDLKPFGRFKIVWLITKTNEKKPNIISVSDLRLGDAMPLDDGEIDNGICNFMIKTKTDVLTDGYTYYTRTGKGFTEIRHSKLTSYKQFLLDQSLEDSLENWIIFLN